jgi:4-hydroxybenzoate polyprenyltransferase
VADSTMRGLAALARAIRPHQWFSNLVIFAPLVFSLNLLQPKLLLRVGVGFLLLCGLSAVTFLVNDAVDRERDRRHPVRRHRPVAAGELPVWQAVLAAIVLAAVSLVGAFLWQPAFALVASGYLLVMVGYSLALRRFPVVDVLAIAGGVVLRAVAGAVLIQVMVSPWLYLGVGGLGLLLALGRVQHEMQLAAATDTLELDKYTPAAVRRMNSVTVATTLVMYCLYTSLAPGLPPDHSMMLTIPIVVYAVFRYRFLASRRLDERSPERLMLADPPLLVAVGLWVLTVVGVLYLHARG